MLHHRTPLIESVVLSNITGKKVLLKMENAHEAGSIKIRGIGRLCESYAKAGCDRFICPSGGNGGYAVAWAGRKLGIKSTIIIPQGAPQAVADNVATLDAEVIVHGSDWYESDKLAHKLAVENEGARYISTYDDPILWEGHSTIVDELVQQCERPDGILMSVGGGGILSGVLLGLERSGWGDVPVIGCGTYGANAFYTSIKAGKLTPIPQITSMVTCLSALCITPKVMELWPKHTLIPYLTTDYSAMDACERFLDDHRIMVDPSCGVTLSALYENTPLIADMKTVVVIVCGGVGIKQHKLAQWKAEAKAKLPYDKLGVKEES